MKSDAQHILQQAVVETLEGRKLFSSVALTAALVPTVQADLSTTPSAIRLTGTPFGTAGSWNNTGATFDKALDRSPSTFFDSPTQAPASVGLDLTTPHTITSVRFVPRSNYASRMVGGAFQASNDNAS